MLEPENRESFKRNMKQWEVDCSEHLKLLDEKFKQVPNSNRINVRIEEAATKLKKVCGPYVSTTDL